MDKTLIVALPLLIAAIALLAWLFTVFISPFFPQLSKWRASLKLGASKNLAEEFRQLCNRAAQDPSSKEALAQKLSKHLWINPPNFKQESLAQFRRHNEQILDTLMEYESDLRINSRSVSKLQQKLEARLELYIEDQEAKNMLEVLSKRKTGEEHWANQAASKKIDILSDQLKKNESECREAFDALVKELRLNPEQRILH